MSTESQKESKGLKRRSKENLRIDKTIRKQRLENGCPKTSRHKGTSSEYGTMGSNESRERLEDRFDTVTRVIVRLSPFCLSSGNPSRCVWSCNIQSK